jgi:hypothetical protein
MYYPRGEGLLRHASASGPGSDRSSDKLPTSSRPHVVERLEAVPTADYHDHAASLRAREMEGESRPVHRDGTSA